MGRTCTICGHDESHQINVALVHREPYRRIASQWNVSTGALQRHSKEHIPELLVKARLAVERSDADDLLARIEELFAEAKEVLEAAKEAADHRVVLAAIDRASRQLELLGRLRGELNDATTVNIVSNPQWLELRTIIVQALDPHPVAREDVVRAITETSGANGSG
jgi:hypothetical protein